MTINGPMMPNPWQTMQLRQPQGAMPNPAMQPPTQAQPQMPAALFAGDIADGGPRRWTAREARILLPGTLGLAWLVSQIPGVSSLVRAQGALNPAPVLTNFQHTDYVAYDPDRLKKAPEGAVKPVTHISNNTAANTTTFTVMLDEANAKTHDGKPLQIAGDYPPITPVLVWGKFEDTMPDGQKRPTFRPLHVNYSETESVPGSEGQVVGLKFTTADTMIPEGSFVQVLMRPTDIGRATASGDVYSALIPLPPATGTPKNVPSPQIPLPERANGVTYEEVDVQGVPHMKVTVDLKPEYKIAKWWTTSDDGKAMARVVQFEAPNSEVMSPDADVQEIRNYLGNVARDKSKIWYTIPMDSFKSGTSIAMGTAPNADADKNWADSIWVERIWLEHPQLKPSFNTGTAIPYLAR